MAGGLWPISSVWCIYSTLGFHINFGYGNWRRTFPKSFWKTLWTWMVMHFIHLAVRSYWFCKSTFKNFSTCFVQIRIKNMTTRSEVIIPNPMGRAWIILNEGDTGGAVGVTGWSWSVIWLMNHLLAFSNVWASR